MKKDLKGESLAVLDKNLAVDIKDKVSGLDIVSDSKTMELFRGIRTYMDELLESATEAAPSGDDIRAMQLGLSHSLSRYKLKFSADKVLVTFQDNHATVLGNGHVVGFLQVSLH